MDKFEEAICGHNPLYKEGLQDKYYQGAKWAWQSRQAEIDEKDKRIEELEKLIEVGRYARQRFINKFIGIQNHIDVNAFKAMESDPECFVIGVEDLTEFIKEVLRGEHE